MLGRKLHSRFLDFAIRQKPDERFVVKIDNLNAVAPRIAKIAAKRRLKFQVVLLGEFFANLLELVFVPNHDPKMTHVGGLRFSDFEDGQELMFTELEESVAFAFIELFEIENVFVKGDRLIDVIDFNRDMVTTVNFNPGPARAAHFGIYTRWLSGQNVPFTWMSSVTSQFCFPLSSAWP